MFDYAKYGFTEADCREIHLLKSRVEVLYSQIVLPKLISMRLDNVCRTIIAGGWFTSVINKETPRDIDVFFLDHTGKLNNDRYNSYINIDKDSQVQYMNNPHVKKAFTIKDCPINFIYTDYEMPVDVIKEFDFLHCCVTYLTDMNKLVLSKDTFEAIKQKHLIINDKTRTPYPFRVNKFKERGFSAPFGI